MFYCYTFNKQGIITDMQMSLLMAFKLLTVNMKINIHKNLY